MNKTDQMSFLGFEADAAAAAPSKPVKMTPLQATSTGAMMSDGFQAVAAPPVAINLSVPSDPEAMAQALAQHPDFRVLRRLQPVADYGGLHGQPTQRVIVLDTETTGLDSRAESIIELAMLSVLVD
ncbi:MAG: polymerase PolC-type, partial [Pseudomonadota bacterium]